MDGEYQQIGTLEPLRERIYPLDPLSDLDHPHTEVVVVPGQQFPVYTDGFSVFWMMNGVINIGRIQRMGDGMFRMQTCDVMSTVEVLFPSKTYGPDEWIDLLAHRTYTDGDPEQRMRFVPSAELAAKS